MGSQSGKIESRDCICSRIKQEKRVWGLGGLRLADALGRWPGSMLMVTLTLAERQANECSVLSEDGEPNSKLACFLDH